MKCDALWLDLMEVIHAYGNQHHKMIIVTGKVEAM